MADSKKESKQAEAKSEAGTEAAPNQPAEDRAAVLERAQTGLATATGVERARLEGADEDIPQGKDRGSTVEIEGDPQPDFAAGKSSKPQGSQAKPANFAVNGSLPVNHVPSPSGPVPAGATRETNVDSAELYASHEDEHRLSAGEPIPEEVIDRLSATELRAIAADRGYNIPHGGTRTTRARLRAEEEKRFATAKK